MGLLSREDLLTPTPFKMERVDFNDGTGEFVFIRVMSGQERDDFEESVREERKRADGETEYVANLKNYRAKIAAMTLCDEHGALYFTLEDVPKLAKAISAPRLLIIAEKAIEVNKLSAESKKDLQKKSDGNQDSEISGTSQ